MKLFSISILCILAVSLGCYAYPHQMLLDLPIAESIGDPGLTSCRISLSISGSVSLDIGRAATDRLDVWMSASASDLFSLGARALLVDHLGPLSMSFELSCHGIALLSSLFLGPVEVDWGITSGARPRRWAAIAASPNQWYSVFLGVEKTTGYSIIAGLRLFPRLGVWGTSIYYRDGEWMASLGGSL